MKGEARVVLYFDISRALAELVHVYVGGWGFGGCGGVWWVHRYAMKSKCKGAIGALKKQLKKGKDAIICSN